MKVAVLVHERQPLEHLVHHVPNHVLREHLVTVVVPLLHRLKRIEKDHVRISYHSLPSQSYLIKVLLHVFEDKVKGVIFSDDLFELDYVVVGQLFQALHLSKVHGLFPRVVFPLHSFDSNLKNSHL